MATETHTSSYSNGLRSSYGRGMTNTYMLPADKRELDRLSLQHRMWRLLQGGTGLYPVAVSDVVNRLLAPESLRSGQDLAVLDIGSGSGIWAVEMAELFPHVRVVGFDLIESKPERVPPNCSFVSGDVTSGMDHYARRFDIVHCRAVRGHVSDVQKFLHDIGIPLRDGGLMLLGDGLFGMFDENRNFLHPQPTVSYTVPAQIHAADATCSWLSRWQYETTVRIGGRALQDEQNHGALTRNLRETGMYEKSSLQEEVYYCPIAWAGSDNPNLDGDIGRELGEIMQENTMEWLQSSSVALLEGGLSRDVVDSWIANATSELNDPNKKLYMNWAVAWGIRKVGIN